MLPVQHNGRLSEEEGQIQLRVHLTKAVVGAGAKHKVVLGPPLLCISRVIPFRVKLVRVVVHVGVVESQVGRGDQHGTYDSKSVRVVVLQRRAATYPWELCTNR